MTLEVGRAARPPSSGRVLCSIARLSLRRSLNRLGSLWRRRPPPGERGATARKGAGGKLLLGFMALVFAWQTVTLAGRLVQRVSRLAEQRAVPGLVVLDPVSFTLLELAAARTEGRARTLSAEGRALLDRAAERPAPGLSEQAAAERGRLIRVTFAERGLAGFRESSVPDAQLWPTSALWYPGADPLELLRPLSVVALLLALAQVLQHVAGSDDDLARVGPGLEWLFSFPVPARALFFARAAAAPFASQLAWVVLFPFHAVVFACSGRGALGVASGALAALYVSLLAGGLRVLLETTLRRALPTIWVSRVQATLLAVSLLPLAAGYTIAFSPVTSGVLEWAAGLPTALLYGPLTLPLVWAVPGGRGLLAALLAVGLLGAWLCGSVVVASWMVRDGVTTGAGEHATMRGSVPSALAPGRGLARGVLLKEWRSLLRDRRSRAQAFVAPLLVFAMQFMLNPSLADSITQNPRHTAAAAFAVAAFSLTTSAFTALAAEGPALYWLYLAPVPLARSLLQKLWVRGGVSVAFGALVFVAAWSTTPALIVPSLPYAALAMMGIVLYAVIALGIGTLGTDVLEPEPRRRVRPGGVYLFMLLAAFYAHAIYTPSSWTKLVQLSLSALLAFAIWQKLLLRLPFLLDPTEAPPPAISVADGVMAALAFFVLQSLIAWPLGALPLAPALATLIAFVSAGSLVMALSLALFRRSGVPDLLRALGLRRRLAAPNGARSIALGVACGVAAGLFGLAYLWAVQRVPLLAGHELGAQDEAQRALGRLDSTARLWLLLLSVGAAPLFEELIFRGILYRGLRHSLRAPAAALTSALVFALVHPGASAAPVFVLALLAAVAYERTGWLAAPVSAHMAYNAMVFGSALLRP